MPEKTDVIDYALRYIYRYPKTEKELVTQLRKKKYSEAEIQKAISYLKKKKYLNDRQFSKDYIDYHGIRKGKPIIYLKQKLYEKGVDKQIINDLIDKYFDQINKGIEKYLKKEINAYKEKGFNGLDIIQKLSRKGYTLNQIKKAIYKLNTDKI